jgi:hypothetical protein
VTAVTNGPGYQALNEVLQALHGDDGYYWLPPDEALGEQTRGLFAGVRVYRVSDPVPHWCYVTLGFSDLGEKNSPDPARSGWGFELTCRVPLAPVTADQGDEPPTDWPFSVLAQLARYILGARAPRWFEVGHNFDLGALIDDAWPLSGLVFAADPLLAPATTVNGRVEFLQIVGLHGDEFKALRSWRATAFLEILRQQNPLLLTDPTRPSLLADAVIAQSIARGIERDGSSLVVMGDVGWVRLGKQPRAEVRIGGHAALQIREALPRMLARGQSLVCFGNIEVANGLLVFTPGDATTWYVRDPEGDSRALVVQLSRESVVAFADALVPPALLQWPELANLTLRVTPA